MRAGLGHVKAGLGHVRAASRCDRAVLGHVGPVASHLAFSRSVCGCEDLEQPVSYFFGKVQAEIETLNSSL